MNDLTQEELKNIRYYDDDDLRLADDNEEKQIRSKPSVSSPRRSIYRWWKRSSNSPSLYSPSISNSPSLYSPSISNSRWTKKSSVPVFFNSSEEEKDVQPLDISPTAPFIPPRSSEKKIEDLGLNETHIEQKSWWPFSHKTNKTNMRPNIPLYK